jgi:hypothetical protein
MTVLLKRGELLETDFDQQLHEPLALGERKLVPRGILSVHGRRLLSGCTGCADQRLS